MPHVIGRADINRLVVPWRAVVEHTELMVMFGGAPAKNMQIDGGGAVLHENARWMHRAAAANIAFVNISPSREDLPGLLKPEWIPIIPHADMPMMLGIAHSLLIAAMLGQIGLPGRGFSIGFGAVNGSASSRPGETLEFDGRKIPLPDIRLIYSAGGNPFHHNPQRNQFPVVAGVGRTVGSGSNHAFSRCAGTGSVSAACPGNSAGAVVHAYG
jgi:hypothetical protein